MRFEQTICGTTGATKDLTLIAADFAEERVLGGLITIFGGEDVTVRCEGETETLEFAVVPPCVVMVDKLTERVKKITMLGVSAEIRATLTAMARLYQAGTTRTSCLSSNGELVFEFSDCCKIAEEPINE